MNGGPLQTPMQPMFNPQPPGAPSRPSYASHRGGQASIAQLAAAGIHPPNVMPITPMGQGFNHAQMQQGMSFSGPSFVPRNRRTPSMSLGGPPKAVLGGPNRKVSPLPPAAAEPAPAPATKVKKTVVKFPQESITEDDGDQVNGDQSIKRPSWARIPLPLAQVPDHPTLAPPELITADAYPSDADRYGLPGTIDVFLPGKVINSLDFLTYFLLIMRRFGRVLGRS